MRYLFYHGPVTEAGARNVETLIATAVNERLSEITLCLSSHGGSVNAGVGLFNFIRMMPIAVHTHAAGPCHSIAVTMLLAGAKRTASPLSNFVLHGAHYTDGPKKGQLSPDTNLISKPFGDILGWSKDDIASRFGAEDYSFGPDAAHAYKLIGGILDPKLSGNDQMVTVNVP